MKNHHPRLFVYSQELIPQIPHMNERDWDYTQYLMRVRSDTIIRGMMDLHPMTINDKMFRMIFVENFRVMPTVFHLVQSKKALLIVLQ